MRTQTRLGRNGPGLLAAGATLGLLVGCSRSAPPATTDDHHHDDELPTAQVTVWEGRYEVFAEHRPAVAAQPTTFVTHVTDLRASAPRAAGPLVLRASSGNEPALEHRQETPTRPGIYQPALTFPKAGTWLLEVIVPDAAGDVRVALPPVRVFADAHEAAHAAVPQPPEGIAFLKEQQWKLQLATAVVGSRQLVERVALPARVLAKPGGSARVTAPAPGQILAPPGGTPPMPGAGVQAGQVLALIQPTFSDAAARLAEAEAGLTRTRASLQQAGAAHERTARLAAQQARSARELEEAAAALATAQAQYDAATALQATYRSAATNGAAASAGLAPIELRAPIAGILSALGAGAGETVEAGQVVFTVLNSDACWIEAQVPEVALPRLGRTGGAAFEVPGAPGVFTDILPSGGRHVFTGLEVDPVTRTVPLVYELANPEGRWRIGQAATLHVESSRVEEALAVPESAIVEEAGRPVAFVQVSGETFEKREVVLGVRDMDWVQVVAGLRAGERVVTRGAFAIRLSSVANALPSHGHAH